MENLEELKKNWDEFARKDPLWAILPLPDKKGNRWDIEELFETGRTEINAVMDYLKGIHIPVERSRALDFGCGVGRLSQALCGYFNECIAVDISAEMIRLAIKYNQCGDRCRYVVNESMDLKTFGDDHFDFIYSNIVFQHIDPNLTIRYVREFIRTIKPGGIIVFQVATAINSARARFYRFINQLVPRNLRRLYKNARYGIWAIKDMYCISEKVLDEHIKSCGGRVVDITADTSSLPLYSGRRYCVRKQRPTNGGKE